MVGMPILGKVGVNLFANFPGQLVGHVHQSVGGLRKIMHFPIPFFSTAYQSQVNQVTKSHRTKVAYHL